MSENLHLLPPGSDVFRIIISTSLMLGTSCPAGALPADTGVDKVPIRSQDLQMWGYFQLSEGGFTSCFLLRRLWAAETPPSHHLCHGALPLPQELFWLFPFPRQSCQIPAAAPHTGQFPSLPSFPALPKQPLFIQSPELPHMLCGHLCLFDLKQINNDIRISLDGVGFLSSGYMPATERIPNHESQQIKMPPDLLSLITRAAKIQTVCAKQSWNSCMVLSDFILLSSKFLYIFTLWSV